MPTFLAFQTPAAGFAIPAGQIGTVGTVDVSSYCEIRVIADSRAASSTGVSLALIEAGAVQQVTLARLALAPAATVTQVYDAPGTILLIEATAAHGTGTDVVDVFVYGCT